MQFTKRISRFSRGFTLMELLVVIAIMALVAALAIPKMADVMSKSQAGTQSYSLAEASRAIENYNAMNGKYPEGWDLLMYSAGDGATAPSGLGKFTDAGTEGSLLNPTLLSMLTSVELTAGQRKVLSNSGISHVFANVAANDGTNLLYMPSDTGRVRHHLGTGSGHDGSANTSTVAVLDTTNAAALSFLSNNLTISPNKDASTDADTIAANDFIVFGIGPRSTLVQTIIQEAPIVEAAQPSKYYARPLAVFMVSKTASDTDTVTKAKFLGMLGPDGRGKGDTRNAYNNVSVTPH